MTVFSELNLQSEIILRVVFPLMVAMNFYENYNDSVQNKSENR